MSIRLKTRVRKHILLTFLVSVIMAAAGYAISRGIDAHASVLDLVAMAWAILLNLFVFTSLLKMRLERWQFDVLFAGYGIRFVLATWTVVGSGPVSSYIQAFGDQLGFIKESFRRYDGLPVRGSTNYTQVLSILYRYTGSYEIIARYVSVLFWFLGAIILSVYLKDAKKKYARIAIGIYAFLPWSILTSVVVMREALLTYGVLLVFYCLWKWMDDGKIKWLVGCLVFSLVCAYMHSANICMMGAVFIVVCLWNVQTHSWGISFKVVLLFAGMIAFVPFYNTFLGGKVTYLPLSLSFDSILVRSNALAPGRTNYVPTISTGSPVALMGWSLYRMVMLWVVPFPTHWSSLFDVVGFVADTCVLLYMFFVVFWDIHYNRCEGAKGRAFTIFFLVVTFVYAWGTRNGGTAMRHRSILFAVIVMMYLIGAKKKYDHERR